MLGNLEDARIIYTHFDTYKPMPDGWGYVGTGTFREAYLSPDGVVYKVPRAPSFSEHNRREHENYLEIRRRKLKYKGWRVNPVNSYKFTYSDTEIVVNVSPLVKGEHEVAPPLCELELAMDAAFAAFNISDDAHDQNYLKTKRGRVIIDLG